MTLGVPAVRDPLLVAGIGEMVFSRDPKVVLVAYGLGSCVGLSAWDPVARVGGLAHFMLPTGDESGGPPVKFVSGGFNRFMDGFRGAGGLPSRAHFKAAGGAAMLQMLSNGLEIGKRNVDAVHGAVSSAGFRLAASDVGGRAGRTVQLEVGTGRLLVKSLAVTTTL
jgi:chemotaxis protein CheD